jgi:hypothetical protein
MISRPKNSPGCLYRLLDPPMTYSVVALQPIRPLRRRRDNRWRRWSGGTVGTTSSPPSIKTKRTALEMDHLERSVDRRQRGPRSRRYRDPAIRHQTPYNRRTCIQTARCHDIVCPFSLSIVLASVPPARPTDLDVCRVAEQATTGEECAA